MTTDSGAGNIRNRGIEDEMRSSYLDYAMSVIVQRALPDIRDGLKPVQRRILYAMQQMGLNPGTKYRKCAGIVGEVLKNYHPHGDAPVYDALVRLVQTFSMRYPLRGSAPYVLMFSPPVAGANAARSLTFANERVGRFDFAVS